MLHFRSIHDVPDLGELLAAAAEIKSNPFAFETLGKRKTIALIFFNPSLRTRLSSQRAATNLGMNTIVVNFDKEGWKLEFEDGAVMNGSTVEHIKDAAPVIGEYCEIVGIRTFAGLQNRADDYSEKVIESFVKYCGRPVVSLESAIRHPLQSLADLITIEEHKTTPKPKVVLTWAPHPLALPQAVANSFVEWMRFADVELVVTHPKGYELAPEFSENTTVVYDQNAAFEGADFIYAKNWSSYTSYGQVLNRDTSWTVNATKMRLTNNAKFMHCLPVRRNMIVTDEVIDGANSLVVAQAANRVVAAQTVFKQLLSNYQ
jgi:N-succinyl-L-ornithine transcarbamylase